MENSTLVQIPLDSPINIKSDSMLEDINKPTFVDNPQQYQGRYLPTSLRFEHNGWAAGDRVYNFEEESTVITDTTGRFTAQKVFITDNKLQVTITDTENELAPFSFYWYVSSVENIPSLSITDNSDLTVSIKIDTVYKDGNDDESDSISIKCTLLWDSKTATLTSVIADDESEYSANVVYNAVLDSWTVEIVNNTYSEVDKEIVFDATCQVTLEETEEGTSPFTIDSVDANQNMLFKYASSQEIVVDKDKHQCLCTYLSDEEKQIVDNTVTYNKENTYTVNNKYNYNVKSYKYKSDSTAYTDIKMLPFSIDNFSINTSNTINKYSVNRTFNNKFSTGTAEYIYGYVPICISFSKFYLIDEILAPTSTISAIYDNVADWVAVDPSARSTSVDPSVLNRLYIWLGSQLIVPEYTISTSGTESIITIAESEYLPEMQFKVKLTGTNGEIAQSGNDKKVTIESDNVEVVGLGYKFMPNFQGINDSVYNVSCATWVKVNYIKKINTRGNSTSVNISDANYEDMINSGLYDFTNNKYLFMNYDKTSDSSITEDTPTSDVSHISVTTAIYNYLAQQKEGRYIIAFDGCNFIVTKNASIETPIFTQLYATKFNINSYSWDKLSNADNSDLYNYYVPALYAIELDNLDNISPNSLHILDDYSITSVKEIDFNNSSVSLTGFYNEYDKHSIFTEIGRLLTLHIDSDSVEVTYSTDDDVDAITQDYDLVTDTFSYNDILCHYRLHVTYTDRSDTDRSDTDSGIFTIGTLVVVDEDDTVVYTPSDITASISDDIISMLVQYIYTFVFEFYDLKIDSVEYNTLVNYYDFIFSFSNGYIINAQKGICTYKNQQFTGVSEDNVFTFTVSFIPRCTYNVQLLGLIESLSPYTINYLPIGDKYVLGINGTNYLFNRILLDNSTPSYILYNSLPVNESGNNIKNINKVDASKEIQFIKQQWDTTVETENFWWIDSSHILRLTQTEMVLLEKTDELDDWAGNKWNVLSTRPRYKYIDNNYIRYGVSSANNAAALFFNIRSDNSVITVNFYDMLSDMDSPSYTISLSLYNIELGNKLNDVTNRLNTYSVATVYDIVTDSKFSCTVIDSFILFGIHYDNNFNQWTVRYNMNTGVYTIVQGYGYVGVDGSLTGGEIPDSYFNASYGFDSTVYPLQDLKQDYTEELNNYTEFNKISSKYRGNVYGTDTTQYYVTDKINGIISHLIWQQSDWKPVVLSTTSNYDACYYSASFAKSIRTDTDTHTCDINQLIPENLKNLFSSAANGMINKVNATELPNANTKEGDLTQNIVSQDRDDAKNINTTALWEVTFKFPRLTSAVYLQQTAGQYAYVHYNNTEYTKVNNTDININGIIAEESDVSISDNPVEQEDKKRRLDSSYLIFDSKSLAQYAKIEPYAGNFADALLTALCNMPYATTTVQTVNAITNPSVTNDEVSGILDTYSQLVLGAVNSLNTSPSGVVVACDSKVVSCLSLDMFYSTSDLQQICAGRGYVNHNFVAQAIAQSCTSRQFEYNQFVSYIIYRQLTTWPLEILLGVGKAMQVAGEAWSNFKAAGSGGAFGAIINMVGYGICAVAQPLLDMYNMIFDFYGSEIMTVKMSANGSKHNYDVETKHKYGNKSEHFMWPSFGVTDNLKYYNEGIKATYIDNAWQLTTQLGTVTNQWTGAYVIKGKQCVAYQAVNNTINSPDIKNDEVPRNSRNSSVTNNNNLLNGKVPYYFANIQGVNNDVLGGYATLPDNMSCIIGAEKICANTPFKNENIGVGEPIFSTPIIHDYMLNKDWKISCTATDSMTLWVGIGDTKLIDGEYSNIIVSNNFCGIASPYTAIEAKRGIHTKYIRPTLITPDALAFNNTGYNCIYQNKMYHAFDSQGYRTVEWVGSSGLNKEQRTLQYNYIANDRFKRSNKLPPNELLGNFLGEPVMFNTVYPDDKIHIQIVNNKEKNSLQVGTIGEDKDVRRLAIPVFSEFVNTLPATVKTISPAQLSVIDGITSLTTNNRNLQSAYKVPVSVDFAIGKGMYRLTAEYICSVTQNKGIEMVENLVPSLGLSFVGATPYEAYLYSDSTKQYYSYTGGTSLTVINTVERFKSLTQGKYNFIEQNVATQFTGRSNDDLTIINLKDKSFVNNVFKALSTICNKETGYKIYSLPCGLLLQGPNRCIISRYLYHDYMLDDIKRNTGKWIRTDKETYSVDRIYKEEFQRVDIQIDTDKLPTGWTHNPFSLILSPLGVSQETDNMYEWEITFCWTEEMDKIYGDKFAVVSISADTYEEGGIVKADRPTHVYLTKEMFSRSGCYGYYSFRYQSKCGAGNREKLYIWSDQYIAISAIKCEYATITNKRQAQLTQQVDVQLLEEL